MGQALLHARRCPERVVLKHYVVERVTESSSLPVSLEQISRLIWVCLRLNCRFYLNRTVDLKIPSRLHVGCLRCGSRHCRTHSKPFLPRVRVDPWEGSLAWLEKSVGIPLVVRHLGNQAGNGSRSETADCVPLEAWHRAIESYISPFLTFLVIKDHFDLPFELAGLEWIQLRLGLGRRYHFVLDNNLGFTPF